MATSCSPKSPAWAKQRSVMLSNWESMRQNGLLTDLTIVCGDKKFKVHRDYMCASIPFFHKMYQTCQESLKDVIEMNSITPEAMSIILDFIYTGVSCRIPDDVKSYEAIFHATNLLQIEPLFDEYYNAFAKLIRVDLFADLMAVAEPYGGNGYASMITFLAKNFFNIIATDEYLALNVNYVKDLLNHPLLKEESTTHVVQAILSWVKFNEKERCDHLESLFSFVDLDDLPADYLQVLTQDNSVIKSVPSVYNKVIAAVLGKLSILSNSEKQLKCFGKVDGTSVTSEFCLEKKIWSPLRTLDFKLEYGMAAVKYMEYFYFIGGGGWEDGYVPSTAIFRYDPITNKSLKLNGLLIPINQAGIGKLGGYLYVVGGRREDNVVTAAVQRVDPINGNTVLVSPTIQHHNAPSVITFRDCLYAIGAARENYSCIERYDAKTDEWTVVTVVPEAVDWSQTTLWKNKLVVLCSNYIKRLHLFDMETECWEMRVLEGFPGNGVWGLWTVCSQSNESPFLLLREASGMFQCFDFNRNAWMGMLGACANPFLWPICLMN